MTAGTFTISTKDTVAETVNITATDGNSKTGSIAGLVINPGAPINIVFVQQPTDTVAGDAISPSVTAQLKDVFGNNVPTADVSVPMSLSSGTGVLSGTTPQMTDAGELATFSDLSINLVGSKNLTASSGSLTSAVSNAFTIIAGAAAKVRVETAADGSGTVVPSQSITSGRSIAVYAVTRNASDNFVANVAADAWSLENTMGSVVSGDLIPGGNSKGAVFTGHFSGAGEIKATFGSLTTTNSGTLTVIPGVNSTSPSHETTGVAINTAISASFSEEMEAATFTTGTFTLNDGIGNISGAVTYSGTTSTFTPLNNLFPFTDYTVTITTGVKDLAGNSTASDYTWSFIIGMDITLCTGELMTVSPSRVRLKAGGRAKVTVTLMGNNTCPVEGETVNAQVGKDAIGIIALPKSPITNVDGQAEFIIITDYWRTARGWVRFKSGNVRARLKIN